MRQRIHQGAVIDAVTPDEIVKLIPRPLQRTRIRATETGVLDGSGNGTLDVYKVPIGYEFEVRRVTLNLSTASDPATGEVVLGAGKYVVYTRSGQFSEYGQPEFGSQVQVPGIQTWGAEQGMYLRNGEMFQVKAVGLTADATLTVVLEGSLARPPVEG